MKGIKNKPAITLVRFVLQIQRTRRYACHTVTGHFGLFCKDCSWSYLSYFFEVHTSSHVAPKWWFQRLQQKKCCAQLDYLRSILRVDANQILKSKPFGEREDNNGHLQPHSFTHCTCGQYSLYIQRKVHWIYARLVRHLQKKSAFWHFWPNLIQKQQQQQAKS